MYCHADFDHVIYMQVYFTGTLTCFEAVAECLHHFIMNTVGRFYLVGFWEGSSPPQPAQILRNIYKNAVLGVILPLGFNLGGYSILPKLKILKPQLAARYWILSCRVECYLQCILTSTNLARCPANY